jgi:hypothetical protein
VKPDESLFRAHLDDAPLLAGVDAGKWGLVGEAKDIIWPHCLLWVVAAPSLVPSEKIVLRFTLDGYPASAPTGCPWDVEKGAKLELAKWPKVTGKFAKVFRTDWNGAVALYAPVDRLAMAGHEHWRQQFPAWWWQPHFTICKFLEFVHIVLNPRNFTSEPA